MEVKKALKFGSIAAVVAALVLAGTALFTEERAVAQLPEYVGSEACLGCHADKYEAWDATAHSSMVEQIMKPSDLPADPNTAPADLKAELDKADYVVAGHRFLARDPATGGGGGGRGPVRAEWGGWHGCGSRGHLPRWPLARSVFTMDSVRSSRRNDAGLIM